MNYEVAMKVGEEEGKILQAVLAIHKLDPNLLLPDVRADLEAWIAEEDDSNYMVEMSSRILDRLFVES